MSLFNELYDRLLTEMPHISLDLPSGKHIDADLEFEHIKTLDELKTFLERILSGETIVSHRGNTYKLSSSHEDKIAFLKEISEFLKMFLVYKKFGISLEELLKTLGH